MAVRASSPQRVIGRYRLGARIGQGSTANVYFAVDTGSGRRVALKLLRPDYRRHPEIIQRFEREARVIARVRHPNAVAIHDVGRHAECPYIVMEYVSGKSLRELLRAQGWIPEGRALSIARQIALGLEAAHRAGIVHRDLKPENVLVQDDGTVKIVDFGLSKALTLARAGASEADRASDSLTVPGTILGTLQYMSPEQAAGARVDCRSDQFAFGAILFELLVGEKAFDRNTPMEVLRAVMEAEPPPILPALPPQLRAVIERCLKRAPDERFPAMRDVIASLERRSGRLDRFFTAALSRFRRVRVMEPRTLTHSSVSTS